MTRRLLAVASIFNGVLRVFGREHGDFIQVDVWIEKTVLTYENAYQGFLNSAYNSIEIRAGDGPDWIRLTGQFSRSGLLDGEGGNDTILGSQQIETLVGGAGNDVIYYQFGDVIDAQEAGLNEFLTGSAEMPETTSSMVKMGMTAFLAATGAITLWAAGVTDVIRGETEVDHILATPGIDDFRGNTGDRITLV